MAYSDEVLADSPIAYWRLNEASGATAADSSSNGHTATFTGTYTRNTAGLLVTDPDPGTSVAGNGYATVPHNIAFNVNNITIEGIINLSGSTTGNVIDRDPETATRIFQLQTGANVMTFIWWTAAGAGPYFITGNSSGRTHFVITLDNAGAKMYFNGVEVANVAQAGGLRTGTEPILIGAHRNGVFNQRFVGELDEIAMYGSALSPARIAVHAAAVGYGPTSAQLSTLYGEVLRSGVPSAQVSTVYAEVLRSGLPMAQLSSIYSEALTSSPQIQTEAVYAEVLANGSGTVEMQAESVYGEVLANGMAELQTESVYLEVLLNMAPRIEFTGWGIPT